MAYAVFDCETTGTDPDVDEIVSLAVVRLDGDCAETARYERLVRPACAIPAEATAVHGISDTDVAGSPGFGEIVGELLPLLEGAVFVAHNTEFDLAMLRGAFARVGVDFEPAGIACTLDAFRLLEPLADGHRLAAICERYDVRLTEAHDALSDVLATAALLRILIVDFGVSPDTAEFDLGAFMRLRSRGDMRPASEPQIRRVFGIARSAGFVAADGSTDRDAVVALVERIVGTNDVDSLTRDQVQQVFDELDRLIAIETRKAA